MKRYFTLSFDRLAYHEDEKLSNRKEFQIRFNTDVAYITSGKSYTLNIRELYTADGRPADEINIMAKDHE